MKCIVIQFSDCASQIGSSLGCTGRKAMMMYKFSLVHVKDGLS